MGCFSPVSSRPYPNATSAAVTAVMKANRKKDTKPEVRLRSALHARGLRFRKDFLVVLPGVRVRADVAFPRQRLAVFADGCFWHRCPIHGKPPRANTSYWGPKLDRNVDRDRRVNEALEANGWAVARIWEHEDPFEAASRIAASLGQKEEEGGTSRLAH